MVYLRLANDNDLSLIMAWRSHPLVYQGFTQQGSPLVWSGHLTWWRSRNSDWRTFVVCLLEDSFDRPIGVVNIGQLDHWSPEVGYLIGEITLWGRGIGTEAVKLGIEWIKEYAKTHKHITAIHTTIHDDNYGSIGIVKKLGFKKGMKARDGETYWIRQL